MLINGDGYPVRTIHDSNNQAKSDVTLLAPAVDSADYKSLRLMADKQVVLNGRLSPATTAHHHGQSC